MSKIKGLEEAKAKGREIIDELAADEPGLCSEERLLSVAAQLYHQDPAAWRALDAILFAIHAHSHSVGTDALAAVDTIPIPVWAAFALVRAFGQWKEGGEGKTPFGVILGLESGDRRQPAHYQKWQESERDRHAALAVAMSGGNSYLETRHVAEAMGVGKRTVDDAYSKHKKAAVATAKRLRKTP